MSQQESSGSPGGDAPSSPRGDPIEDLVDAFPSFGFHSRLNDNSKTVEEAMEVQKASIANIDTPAYTMDRKRGLALIINNEEFHASTGMNSRSGSTRDVDSMRTVLSQKLGFNVLVRNNLAVAKMKKLFEDISLDNHSENDCFVCVILSHGDDKGIVYGTDGSVALDDLVAYILPNKCKTLAGKPKLFFVQACRGTKLDKGVETHDAIGGFGEPPAQKIPLWADMLIAYSSVPGYFSWRNCRNGSWFIQSLSQVLEQYGNELEIQQIMTKVNFRVAYEFESKSNEPRMNRMKQVPCVSSMLTKELFFPVIEKKQ